MSDQPIYHLCPRSLWEVAESEGFFLGRPDISHGETRAFLHLSTIAQVRESAARHCSGMTDLVLLVVDPGGLGEVLRWEPSRGDELFPHLYGPLPLNAVIAFHDLPLGSDNRHQFPPIETLYGNGGQD